MSRKNRATFLGNVGIGSYFRVHHNLWEAVAFKVLTPMERLILLDMMRVYFRFSHADTQSIDGFPYTHAHCNVPVNQSTFYKAIGKILKHGFFSVSPEKYQPRPGAPNKYLPSIAWKSYTPSKVEAAALKGREDSKAHRMARDRMRRTEFLRNVDLLWSKNDSSNSGARNTETPGEGQENEH